VPDIPLDEPCPKCGRNLMIRHGRYGEFTACSGYPDCKFVKQNFIGMEVPAVQGWGPGGEEGAQGQHFLRLLELPQVQVHRGPQAINEKCPVCSTNSSWKKI